MALRRLFLAAVACTCVAATWLACAAILAVPRTARSSEGDLAAAFACEVDRRLSIPEDEQARYAQLLQAALEGAGLGALGPQHVLLVDRSPMVQAAILYLRTAEGGWRFTGASPAATGAPGTYEHFATPLGVFVHSMRNPDFRAQGTINEFGVRGYGREGMRVFDFGWVSTRRGWGSGAEGEMRLQVHATDPDLLEPQLGTVHSKGCIRIPATLDVFLDRRGVLDEDYERVAESGNTPWVLLPNRETTRWPGRYLVIVDSARAARPAWSKPGARRTPRPAECPKRSP